MAKEKLHHLQELVKVVQQGGGPNLPIGDLENLTLTLSDDQNDSSEYGESEEEADEDNDESDEEEEEEESDEEDTDGEQTEEEEEKSETSKSTDMNYNVCLILLLGVVDVVVTKLLLFKASDLSYRTSLSISNFYLRYLYLIPNIEAINTMIASSFLNFDKVICQYNLSNALK